MRPAFLAALCLMSASTHCDRSTGPDTRHPTFHVTLSSPAACLRVSDSTTVIAQGDIADSVALSYGWHATVGRIEGEGREVVYIAPDSAGEAIITVRLQAESWEGAEDSISLVIYRQFVMLKADDLTAEAGKSLSPRWERFLDYVLAKGLKAGLGLIGNSLEDPSSVYTERVQNAFLSGHFEIWNHGYDHMLDTVSQPGVHIREFYGTSYEHQAKHLQRTQDLARMKLGITLHTFGAPYDHFDQSTLQVIDETEDIRVWLLGNPASSKLVLGRYAEIEFPVHNPDYEKFLEDYDSQREFLVFEIHPASWDDRRFEQFEQIIDYLTAADVTFVTPYEYYLLHKP